jgi:hypothetical protein
MFFQSAYKPVQWCPQGLCGGPVSLEHMKCFELAWMFAGMINRRFVISCHPFFVVCAKGIAAEFATLECAERFLSGRGFGAGCIYRHNGRDWDKLEKNPWAIDHVDLIEPTVRWVES